MTTHCFCRQCGDDIAPARVALGYHLCLSCGDAAARKERSNKWIVAIPYSKGAYQVVSTADIAWLNPKRIGG